MTKLDLGIFVPVGTKNAHCAICVLYNYAGFVIDSHIYNYITVLWEAIIYSK